MYLCGFIAILFWSAVPLAGQGTDSRDNPLAALNFLVGTWEGQIDGSLGTGTGIREYEWILDDNFLMSTHASVRMPQPRSPGGDHHREVGIFSYDSERELIVYRQFVVEGFVNRYTCQPPDAGPGFTCVTEGVENGPGIRARWTMTPSDGFTLEEVFELGEPDQEFGIRFTNRWIRRPTLP